MSSPDDLSAGLERAANSIDVGDADLEAVHATVRRRRLRQRLVGGLGVVALFATATVAVIAVNSDPEPDTFATADPVEEPEATAPPTDTVEPVSTELSTATAQGVEILDRPGNVSQIGEAGGAPASGEWSAPWKDGFLVGARTYEPQPLPDELPEEIIALFPQEVRDLFGGQLPPTIAEATDMLSEAGLLDVVSEVLSANPEASDAIYGVEVDNTPTLDVRFTTDGQTWTPIDMTPPPGAEYFPSVHAVGDRLVVAYTLVDPLTGRSLNGTLRIATTSDLVEWEVQDIVIEQPAIELPEGVSWNVDLSGFATNETGWLASVYSGANVDPYALLPEERRAELDDSIEGYGAYNDEFGIVFERYGEDGVPSETFTITWEELGIDADVAEYLDGRRYETALWAAPWGGVPTESAETMQLGGLLATDAGFLQLSPNSDMLFSPDGLTWTPRPLPVDDAFVTSAFAFDGGVIGLATPGRAFAEVYRFDETGGSPERIDIPGFPEFAQYGYGSSSGEGLILEASDPGPPPPPLVVEADGYRFELDNETGTVVITEVATGDVVVTSETMFENVFENDPDAPIQFSADGVTVTDPETAAVVVFFPSAALEAASEALFSDTEGSGDDYLPDTWLLATHDGERFLLDDLDDSADGGFSGIGPVSNGARLLIQTGTDWVLYDLS